MLTPNPTPPATRTNPHPVPAPLTNAEIAVQKANWEERRKLYNEVQAIELALRNQITEAFEPESVYFQNQNILEFTRSTSFKISKKNMT